MFLSDVKRKLGFLGKKGYDIFGKNKYFAPRMRWQALESIVQDIKVAAQSYETAFNDVMSIVKNHEDFQQVSNKENVRIFMLVPVYNIIPRAVFVKPRPKQLLWSIKTDADNQSSKKINVTAAEHRNTREGKPKHVKAWLRA